MRRAIIAALSSTVALACPAQAKDGDFYVGIDLGVAMPTDKEIIFTPGIGAGTTGTATPDLKLGLDSAAVVGYDLGPVRVEAEASYKSSGIKEIAYTGLTFPGSAAPGGPAPGAGTTSASGDISSLSFMGNAMVDLGNEDDISFFVGGGAGIAIVKVSEMRATIAAQTLGIIIDDEDSRFAWQAFAGVRKAISKSLDVQIRYRYFNVDDLELVGFGGRAINAKSSSHSVLAGIRFNFW